MFAMTLLNVRTAGFAAGALALSLSLIGCGSGDASYTNPQQQPVIDLPVEPTMTVSGTTVYESDPITFTVTAPDRPDVTVIEASFDGGATFELINTLGQTDLTISFAYSGAYGTKLINSGGTIYVRPRVLSSVGAEVAINILCLDITGEGLILAKLSQLQTEKDIGSLLFPTSDFGHDGGQPFPGHFDIDFSFKTSGKVPNYFFALDYNARNGQLVGGTPEETALEIAAKNTDWEALSSIRDYRVFAAMTWEQLTAAIDALYSEIKALPT